MIQFELVSPEKKLYSASVAMVTLPGAEGDFGVLEGHAPFISTMRVGVIHVYANKQNEITARMLVSGGVVEVNASQCTVLAEEAVPLEAVSRDLFVAELGKLHDLLQIANGKERVDLEAKIALIRQKLDLLALLRQ